MLSRMYTSHPFSFSNDLIVCCLSWLSIRISVGRDYPCILQIGFFVDFAPIYRRESGELWVVMLPLMMGANWTKSKILCRSIIFSSKVTERAICQAMQSLVTKIGRTPTYSLRPTSFSLDRSIFPLGINGLSICFTMILFDFMPRETLCAMVNTFCKTTFRIPKFTSGDAARLRSEKM